MQTIVVLAVLVAAAMASPLGEHHGTTKINQSLNLEWTMYKERHGKEYSSADEELARRVAWEDNLKIIESHNRLYAIGLKKYRLGATKFADMTNQEYRQMVLMKNKIDAATLVQKNLHQTLGHMGENPTAPMPKSVDWRKEGYVTGIKDQGQCGSCWSFSTTGSVEGQHFKATGKLVSLSEKNLMDCSGPEGNQSCDGGLMDQAFEYIIKNKGIDTEASYPYVPEDGRCKYNKANIGATISSYKDIPTGDEMSLASAIATVGPISVAIDASQSSFQLYDSGVYDEPACSSTQLDHGVLAVGYGTDQSGGDYYIVKNSWGVSWGMSGYIWMSRNKDNQCGIATASSYPIV
jgi:cathepsin L